MVVSDTMTERIMASAMGDERAKEPRKSASRSGAGQRSTRSSLDRVVRTTGSRVLAASSLDDEDTKLHRHELSKMIHRYLLEDPVDQPL
jgi:hypothetical protein